MTTVAFDGKFLVSDSQATSGSKIRLGDVTKIFINESEKPWTIEGKVVNAFGFSGRANSKSFLLEYLTEGITHKLIPSASAGGFQMLAVCEDGSVFTWSHSPKDRGNESTTALYPVTGPYAIGSGATYAESIMSIGGCAEEAVKAGIRLDVNSGGGIQIWDKDYPKIINVIKPELTLFKDLVKELKDIVNKECQNPKESAARLNEISKILNKEEYASLT